MANKGPYLFRRDECLRYVDNGQTVILTGDGSKGIVCTVEKACGHSAFVVNEMKGIRKWCDVTDLFSYEEYVKRRTQQKEEQTK